MSKLLGNLWSTSVFYVPWNHILITTESHSSQVKQGMHCLQLSHMCHSLLLSVVQNVHVESILNNCTHVSPSLEQMALISRPIPPLYVPCVVTMSDIHSVSRFSNSFTPELRQFVFSQYRITWCRYKRWRRLQNIHEAGDSNIMEMFYSKSSVSSRTFWN